MPKPLKGPRLGGSPSHQKHIVRNLAKELIKYGRIQTTVKKAKVTQPYVERLVKYAKKGDVHNIRLINKFLNDKTLTRYMVEAVGPANAERPGGATRVVKIGPRKSDKAPMAIFEWSDEIPGYLRQDDSAAEETTVTSGRRWGRRKQADETPEAEAPKARSVDDDAASVTPEEVEARFAAEEEAEETEAEETEAETAEAESAEADDKKDES